MAVSGYDLVSYFNNDSPQKGNKEHAVVYDSATYYFSTEENKSMFKSAPEKYLPQYGGWCAYAMALGKNVQINPQAYLVDEGLDSVVEVSCCRDNIASDELLQ